MAELGSVAALRAGLEQFINRSPNVTDKNSVERSLTAIPQRMSTTALPPVSQLEQKVHFIAQLLASARAIQPITPERIRLLRRSYALLLVVPVENFPTILGDTSIVDIARDFIPFYMQKGRMDRLIAESVYSAGSTQSNISIERSSSSRNIAFRRDGKKCLFTHTPYPDVCHIIPFVTNKNEERNRRQVYYNKLARAFFSRENYVRFYTMQSSSPGSNDKPSNMLCLSKTLHDWWSRAVFGLQVDDQAMSIQPVSKTDSKLTIKFRWLHKNTLPGNDDVEPTVDELHKMVAFESQADKKTCSLTNEETSLKIQDGDTAEIIMAHEDILDMHCMLSFMWHMCVASQMVGGGGVTDDYDYEKDTPPKPIHAWLDQVEDEMEDKMEEFAGTEESGPSREVGNDEEIDEDIAATLQRK
ncbi:hypothetical protein NLG97_g5143 [Lecanicillium saksenae]|uniref:Uncharacterized protein n=1 Tax=Lecanicillium saksenae TaxID=468837 RepID=A0ACC1QUY0_9HYPO|nr:hypothetical protein NLG97_g5143 [Lecanicillium saksenae]